MSRVSFRIWHQFVTFRCWVESRVSHQTSSDGVSSHIPPTPRLGTDLYGHLHGIVIAAHSKNLSFIDFTEGAVAQSPAREKKNSDQNKTEMQSCLIKRAVNVHDLTSYTSEELCFCVELPSGHWARQSCPRSSSWGCSPSWWWRSGSCWVCTLDCAGDPSPRASRSSCGTTLSTKMRHACLFHSNYKNECEQEY